MADLIKWALHQLQRNVSNELLSAAFFRNVEDFPSKGRKFANILQIWFGVTRRSFSQHKKFSAPIEANENLLQNNTNWFPSFGQMRHSQMVQIHRRHHSQTGCRFEWSRQTSVWHFNHQRCDRRWFGKVSLRCQQFRRRWECRDCFDCHRTTSSQNRSGHTNHWLWSSSCFHLPFLW